MAQGGVGLIVLPTARGHQPKKRSKPSQMKPPSSTNTIGERQEQQLVLQAPAQHPGGSSAGTPGTSAIRPPINSTTKRGVAREALLRAQRQPVPGQQQRHDQHRQRVDGHAAPAAPAFGQTVLEQTIEAEGQHQQARPPGNCPQQHRSQRHQHPATANVS